MNNTIRQLLTSVRSYITVLTSLLGECQSKGKLLLQKLRLTEDKCQQMLPK